MKYFKINDGAWWKFKIGPKSRQRIIDSGETLVQAVRNEVIKRYRIKAVSKGFREEFYLRKEDGNIETIPLPDVISVIIARSSRICSYCEKYHEVILAYATAIKVHDFAFGYERDKLNIEEGYHVVEVSIGKRASEEFQSRYIEMDDFGKITQTMDALLQGAKLAA
jgi:hypothetical protein